MCLLPIMGIYVAFFLGGFPFFGKNRVKIHSKKSGSIRKAKDLPSRPKNRSSAFRAFCLALGGTLGVGNISGVAMALSVGGAGALFWMWVCALPAMFLKYAEVALAVEGTNRGSNPRFDTGKPTRAPSLGYLFSGGKTNRIIPLLGGVFCACGVGLSLSMGAMMQSNAVSSSLGAITGLSPVLIAFVLAPLTCFSIAGGTERLARQTEKLIPAAALLYSCLCLVLIIRNRSALPHALGNVLRGAFEIRAAGGGFFGFAWVRAFRVGCQRGLLSNEAGCGTAPMAHATAVGVSPRRQGLLGMAEVAVDTLFLCTLTGFALLTSDQSGAGMLRVIGTFGTLGKTGVILLTLCVSLFAFATVLAWYHYGKVCLSCFGFQRIGRIYPLLFAGAVFIGCVMGAEGLFAVTDLWLSVMTLINLAALFRNRKKIREITFPGSRF